MTKTYVLKITTLNGTQYKNCSLAKKALYNLLCVPSWLKILLISSDNILENNSKKKNQKKTHTQKKNALL